MGSTTCQPVCATLSGLGVFGVLVPGVRLASSATPGFVVKPRCGLEGATGSARPYCLRFHTRARASPWHALPRGSASSASDHTLPAGSSREPVAATCAAGAPAARPEQTVASPLQGFVHVGACDPGAAFRGCAAPLCPRLIYRCPCGAEIAVGPLPCSPLSRRSYVSCQGFALARPAPRLRLVCLRHTTATAQDSARPESSAFGDARQRRSH